MQQALVQTVQNQAPRHKYEDRRLEITWFAFGIRIYIQVFFFSSHANFSHIQRFIGVVYWRRLVASIFDKSMPCSLQGVLLRLYQTPDTSNAGWHTKALLEFAQSHTRRSIDFKMSSIDFHWYPLSMWHGLEDARWHEIHVTFICCL